MMLNANVVLKIKIIKPHCLINGVTKSIKQKKKIYLVTFRRISCPTQLTVRVQEYFLLFSFFAWRQKKCLGSIYQGQTYIR